MVDSSGAALYVLMRGTSCGAPVLLWLHGGPGGAETPLFRLYNRALEDRYVVAYWDQRGAGESFDPKADVRQLTVAQHLQDLDVVVGYLRERFGKQKIILVGHSWGAALGLIYASQHPDQVAAIVAVNPLIAGLDSQKAQLAFVTKQAQQRNDAKVLAAVQRIGGAPYRAADILNVQGLVDLYGGVFHRRPNFALAVLEGIVRAYVLPWDIPSYIEANTITLTAMHDELTALDLRKRVPAIGVPLIAMVGRYDRQADPAIAAGYVEIVKSPDKRLIWFEQSAHNIPFEEPELFNSKLQDALESLRRDRS